MLRRRTAPSEELQSEIWFKQGRGAFKNKCAGCHALDVTAPRQNTLLSWENMKEKGYEDPRQIQYVIRYGYDSRDRLKQMPGYAADCADANEYGICNTVIPLDEEKLRNIQDYVLNRAAAGWPAEPTPPKPPPQ